MINSVPGPRDAPQEFCFSFRRPRIVESCESAPENSLRPALQVRAARYNPAHYGQTTRLAGRRQCRCTEPASGTAHHDWTGFPYRAGLGRAGARFSDNARRECTVVGRRVCNNRMATQPKHRTLQPPRHACGGIVASSNAASSFRDGRSPHNRPSTNGWPGLLTRR